MQIPKSVQIVSAETVYLLSERECNRNCVSSSNLLSRFYQMPELSVKAGTLTMTGIPTFKARQSSRQRGNCQTIYLHTFLDIPSVLSGANHGRSPQKIPISALNYKISLMSNLILIVRMQSGVRILPTYKTAHTKAELLAG